MVVGSLRPLRQGRISVWSRPTIRDYRGVGAVSRRPPTAVHRGWDMTEDAARELAGAARSMQEAPDPQCTLERGLEVALELIEGARHAGVSLVRRGTITSPAVTDDVVRRIDALQAAHGEGPGIAAVTGQEVVHSADLAHDARWPRWGPEVAAQTGVHSMLSFPLFTGADTVGALNVYSPLPSAFTTDDREHGFALAAHLALAYVAANEIETLEVALDTRTLIGQATGILMERYDLDGEQAFGVLRRISQESNTKLRLVAQDLVRTRTLADETAATIS